jgi:uncharacterized protein
LVERLAVCRLASNVRIPAWAFQGVFFCVARVRDELSIVCQEDLLPHGEPAERGWVALKLEGPFPFTMTGVLAEFIQPLAEAEIAIFAISTFDTDYVLIKRDKLDPAIAALNVAGHAKLNETHR